MDTLFFIASKVIWSLLRPDAWIVIGTGLALLAIWRGWRRLAGWAASLVFGFVLLVAVVPIGDVLLRPLEARYPGSPQLNNITGIIILGGGEDGTF